jgi:hypothetical protein
MGRLPAQTNIPDEELRWEIRRAAEEFRLARGTLRKYFAGIGARPGADGCFSTAQITAAAFGDLHAARLGLIREHRKKASIHNAILEGTVLDRNMMEAGLSAICDAMVARIRASALDRRSQDDLLVELASVGTVLDGVIKEQSQLRRARRHADGDDDPDDPDGDLDEDDVPGTGKVPKRPFRRKPGFRAEKAKTS